MENKMKKILLLLANGFEIYEASAFIDVIGWNSVYGDKSVELVKCGLYKELKSTFNLIVQTDILINEVNVDDYEALAIPGGFEIYGFYNDAYNEIFLNLIKEFNLKNKIIASICVAALPLGKSGILKGKKGTTYNSNDKIRQNQLKGFGVDVLNKPIVIDENIITSWNPSTAIDVSLKLLELLTSKKNAKQIKKMMGFTK
jgi:4-methyl-5(b-hydroxyethyl)-thiazole monophosphate biosynthesis